MRSVEANNISIFVNQKLRKVPWNLLGHLLVRVLKLIRIPPQVLVQLVGIFAVDVNLFKERELDLLALGKLINLLITAILLHEKLIAGKCKDLQTTVLVLLINLNQLLVVLLSHASLGRHINNNGNFFTFHLGS